MDIQASVSVGHENLRTGEAFDKPHPTPEVLLTSTASSCHQRDDRVHLGSPTLKSPVGPGMSRPPLTRMRFGWFAPCRLPGPEPPLLDPRPGGGAHMAAEPRVRRPRADFERNRSEILAQAERHFSAEGVGASLEAVARDAGVGSATLYRHFPTRDALLAEVLERRATQLDAEIERIETLGDSDAALEAWLLAMEDFFGAYEGLPGPMRSAFLEEHNPLATTCVGFIELTDRLLRAAQED